MTTPAADLRSETLVFPNGFIWGAATSAYQIEGAVHEDGRGVSIWDTFCRTPGKTENGENGDVAADHFHRFREDIALMRELGLGAYRFSIAWPRVQPGGRGPANQRGLDFYRRLVDALLEEGIEPYITLYHWDLPQELEDEGGWAARETAYCFAEYAGIVSGALGDRVSHWLTLNEPWCSAFLGYGLGRHAPGIHDAQKCVSAVHHLLLGHGLAVEEIRKSTPPGAVAGIVLNLEPHRPLTQSTADLAAARLWDGMQNRIFLDPILKGYYPKDVLDHLGKLVDLTHIQDGDDRIISAPIDVLGVNYYRPSLVAARAEPAPGGWAVWPGDESIEPIPQAGAKTTMGWVIDPTGLAELLARLRDDYPGMPMLLTENGASFDDSLAADGRVRDTDRISFLDQHLRVLHNALETGVDLRGYVVWSLLDNFEWAEGYSKRFGIVFVDYETQQRIPKESAHWYQRVIAANGLAGAR
ncbi:MAG TPA: GH1 family beta-glucosidase [Gaiellaceae bacterium]|nr:GH1 family beta-glucosidase [Gaiellaceae bacterium]